MESRALQRTREGNREVGSQHSHRTRWLACDDDTVALSDPALTTVPSSVVASLSAPSPALRAC